MLVAAAPAVLLSCKPSLESGVISPPATWPVDARFADRCPPMNIHDGEYATITVVSADHAEAEMLVESCDESALSGCAVEFCSPARRTANAFCLSPTEAARRLYLDPAGKDEPSAGTSFLAEPFCFGGRCELALALLEYHLGGQAAGRLGCHLVAGQVRFEASAPTAADEPGAASNGNGVPRPVLILGCKVQRSDGLGTPRDCYPVD